MTKRSEEVDALWSSVRSTSTLDSTKPVQIDMSRLADQLGRLLAISTARRKAGEEMTRFVHLAEEMHQEMDKREPTEDLVNRMKRKQEMVRQHVTDILVRTAVIDLCIT